MISLLSFVELIRRKLAPRGVPGGEVFADWQKVIADALRRRGVAATRATSVATLLLASIEGAIILCRAQRSLRPLERVSDELELVMASALEAEQPGAARASVEE